VTVRAMDGGDTQALAGLLFRRIVTELGWRLGPAVMASITLAVTEGVGLLLLVPLLGSIGLLTADGSAAGLAAVTTRAFALVGLTPSLEAVLVAFLALSMAYATIYRWHLLLAPRIEQEFVLALRQRLYEAILGARWSFLVQRRASDLAHALTADLNRVGTAAHQLLTIIVGLGITLVYLVFAAKLSPALTTFVVAGALVLLIALRDRMKGSAGDGAAYSEASRRLHRSVAESLAALKVAKSTGSEGRDAEAFRSVSRTASERYLALITAFADSKRRLDMVSAAGLCVLVLVAVKGFGIRGATLLLVVFIFARLMPRMLALQESIQLFVAGLPAFAHVVRLQEECENESERLQDTGERLQLGYQARLEGVDYRYVPDGRDVLKNVTATLEAGRTTALVGPSGGGKSTLADLVMGLLLPTNGRVLVDGTPLTATRLKAWRQAIGYVPQDTFLLHDTIRANLAWAMPVATEQDMWDALGLASARHFVSASPDGLDTIVGDRGVRLSGGERQRLALARALLRRPSLLILDEATSALDAVSEQEVLDAIHNLHGRLTILLITHRLSAVRGADIVHVISDGQLVESGTWLELSGADGSLFRRLWQIQRLETVGA
jgi:ATP-binding cassette subfamily C protein